MSPRIKKLVEKLISSLKPRDARIVSLFSFAQMTSSEVSDFLNHKITPANIRQILHRSKVSMRQIAISHFHNWPDCRERSGTPAAYDS